MLSKKTEMAFISFYECVFPAVGRCVMYKCGASVHVCECMFMCVCKAYAYNTSMCVMCIDVVPVV